MATLSPMGGPRTPAGTAYALASRLASGGRDVQPYDHDELVLELTVVLEIGGFGTIHACAGPYDRPALIPFDEASLIDPDEREAYAPDVATVSRSGKLDLFAVETPHTLFKASTGRAWRAFVSRAGRHGRGAFWVVVRKPLLEVARLRLVELQLQGRVLTL